MVTVEKQRKETGSRATVAALDHLSGPSVGLQTLLFSRELDVHLNPDRFLHVTKSGKPVEKKPGSELIARLVRTSDSYQLEACNNASIWINGRKIDSGELHHDDIVEFGEKGPLSRFRLLNSSTHQRRYFSQVCDDCWDYIRTSRKPVYSRLAKAFGEGAHRIAAGSTILFRATVLITLLLLGLVTYQQYNINEMQQAALTASQGQIDDFSQTLARAREEALTPNDLEELKDVLSRDLSASSSRLDALEKGTAATQTVIRNTSSSVVFLLGSYGYREISSGRVMRHVLGPDGRPLIAPNSAPILSLDGNGAIAERTVTGTGFAVADGSFLVTNRHVAVPWSSDSSGSGSANNGMEPFMIRLIGYSPGLKEARELKLLTASTDTDLALLGLSSDEEPLVPLPIATLPVERGSPVVVLGYPTGLRSMVARAGGAFVAELQESGETGFWDVARRLSEKSIINPLASLGIVAQLTNDFLVYDAATTRGGSGGPVLNSQGEVIAVTVAILPEYGGSNLGIPAQKLKNFISESDALAKLEPEDS